MKNKKALTTGKHERREKHAKKRKYGKLEKHEKYINQW